MIKASENFTKEEIERIKFILKLFNGVVVDLQRRENKDFSNKNNLDNNVLC